MSSGFNSPLSFHADVQRTKKDPRESTLYKQSTKVFLRRHPTTTAAAAAMVGKGQRNDSHSHDSDCEMEHPTDCDSSTATNGGSSSSSGYESGRESVDRGFPWAKNGVSGPKNGVSGPISGFHLSPWGYNYDWSSIGSSGPKNGVSGPKNGVSGPQNGSSPCPWGYNYDWADKGSSGPKNGISWPKNGVSGPQNGVSGTQHGVSYPQLSVSYRSTVANNYINRGLVDGARDGLGQLAKAPKIVGLCRDLHGAPDCNCICHGGSDQPPDVNTSRILSSIPLPGLSQIPPSSCGCALLRRFRRFQGRDERKPQPPPEPAPTSCCGCKENSLPRGYYGEPLRPAAAADQPPTCGQMRNGRCCRHRLPHDMPGYIQLHFLAPRENYLPGSCCQPPQGCRQPPSRDQFHGMPRRDVVDNNEPLSLHQLRILHGRLEQLRGEHQQHTLIWGHPRRRSPAETLEELQKSLSYAGAVKRPPAVGSGGSGGCQLPEREEVAAVNAALTTLPKRGGEQKLPHLAAELMKSSPPPPPPPTKVRGLRFNDLKELVGADGHCHETVENHGAEESAETPSPAADSPRKSPNSAAAANLSSCQSTTEVSTAADSPRKSPDAAANLNLCQSETEVSTTAEVAPPTETPKRSCANSLIAFIMGSAECSSDEEDDSDSDWDDDQVEPDQVRPDVKASAMAAPVAEQETHCDRLEEKPKDPEEDDEEEDDGDWEDEDEPDVVADRDEDEPDDAEEETRNCDRLEEKLDEDPEETTTDESFRVDSDSEYDQDKPDGFVKAWAAQETPLDKLEEKSEDPEVDDEEEEEEDDSDWEDEDEPEVVYQDEPEVAKEEKLEDESFQEDIDSEDDEEPEGAEEEEPEDKATTDESFQEDSDSEDEDEPDVDDQDQPDGAEPEDAEVIEACFLDNSDWSDEDEPDSYVRVNPEDDSDDDWDVEWEDQDDPDKFVFVRAAFCYEAKVDCPVRAQDEHDVPVVEAQDEPDRSVSVQEETRICEDNEYRFQHEVSEAYLAEINRKWRLEYELEHDSKRETSRKMVRFASDDVLSIVHEIEWTDNKGPWEEAARDRCRFQLRIQRTGETLAPILDAAHRDRVYRATVLPYLMTEVQPDQDHRPDATTLAH